MSVPQKAAAEPITDRRQLAAYLEAGCKPPEAWRIGTEHEKFPFRLADLSPVAHGGPDGIRALLEGLTRFGWERVEEDGHLIGLSRPDGSSVSLEPGGQFELSGAPLRTIHETCAELHSHLRDTKEVCRELGLGMLGMGFTPLWRREDIPWMPKGRYRLMRDYMPRKGGLGIDMMIRTCTVQVNLDYGSEPDMVQKLRVALALQPIATALFAASPFREGRPNGFQSLRSQVWTDTDPDRTGDLPFVFEDGFGFERYVDYALSVPMYFVYRNGTYIDAMGQDFRAFLDGRLPALPGQLPTLADWADHLTTIFPEARLKKFIEMRGADGGPWQRLCSLPALWTGLLYDQQALDAAWNLCRDWTAAERRLMRQEVPRLGLSTPFRGRTLRDLAREVVAIAGAGLKRRARQDWIGTDESPFLDTLRLIVESGRTLSTELLEKFHGPWGGSVAPAFVELDY